MFIRTTLSLTLALTATLAAAQSKMVRLDQAAMDKYTASCTVDRIDHTCANGDVVAKTPEGGYQCRPSPKVYPFAKQGETPCVSDVDKKKEDSNK